MKILLRQFLSQKHSWSYIGHELARTFKKMGHNVDLFPTDGINGILPNDLKDNVIGYTNVGNVKVFGKESTGAYDMQYSYTALRNAESYMKFAKNKFVQWTYEWGSKKHNILPNGFNIGYKYCDYILAPSNYTKEYQLISGKIPENKIKIIPHGINVDNFKSNITFNLKTDKKFKFLINLQQTHLRKNLEGVLEAFGKAFSNKDDVCLVIKAVDKKPEVPFEFSLSNYLKSFYSKFPNHADIKVISDFIPNIAELYNSVDCAISLAYGEGFNMPLLESLAAGKPVIATNLGPHLDFVNENGLLNNKDTLLVNSKFDKANPKSMYWGPPNPNAEAIYADIDHAAEQMLFMYNNYSTFIINRNFYYENYSWENIGKKVMNLLK